MTRRGWTLAGAGVAVVTAAAIARLALDREETALAPPPRSAAPVASAPPPAAAAAPAAAPPDGGTAPAPPPVEDDVDATPVRDVAGQLLGGFEAGRPLPLCGRSGSVPVRRTPDGEATGAELPGCEDAFLSFPDLSRQVPVLSAGNGWVQLASGWVPVAEARTVEVLRAGGREYWHGLFNAEVAEVSGRRVVLVGDEDPCADQHCGSGYAVMELEASLVAEHQQAHPGKELPPEVALEISRKVEEAQRAADAEDAEAREAIRERKRVRRTIELVEPPPDGAGDVAVDRASYECCT